MNRQLSEHQIRSTCRSLMTADGRASGRQLREELRRRFGAVGKTERIFRVWREECARRVAADLPSDVAELMRRLTEAETRAAAQQARAELAEYREQAHQERWAVEVDRLRQELRAHETSAGQVRRLQERVLQLSRELVRRGESTGSAPTNGEPARSDARPVEAAR